MFTASEWAPTERSIGGWGVNLESFLGKKTLGYYNACSLGKWWLHNTQPKNLHLECHTNPKASSNFVVEDHWEVLADLPVFYDPSCVGTCFVPRFWTTLTGFSWLGKVWTCSHSRNYLQFFCAMARSHKIKLRVFIEAVGSQVWHFWCGTANFIISTLQPHCMHHICLISPQHLHIFPISFQNK